MIKNNLTHTQAAVQTAMISEPSEIKWRLRHKNDRPMRLHTWCTALRYVCRHVTQGQSGDLTVVCQTCNQEVVDSTFGQVAEKWLLLGWLTVCGQRTSSLRTIWISKRQLPRQIIATPLPLVNDNRWWPKLTPKNVKPALTRQTKIHVTVQW